MNKYKYIIFTLALAFAVLFSSSAVTVKVFAENEISNQASQKNKNETSAESSVVQEHSDDNPTVISEPIEESSQESEAEQSSQTVSEEPSEFSQEPETESSTESEQQAYEYQESEYSSLTSYTESSYWYEPSQEESYYEYSQDEDSEEESSEYYEESSESESSVQEFLPQIYNDPLAPARAMNTILPVDDPDFENSQESSETESSLQSFSESSEYPASAEITHESNIFNSPPIPSETTENTPVVSEREQQNSLLFGIIIVSLVGIAVTVVLIILLNIKYKQSASVPMRIQRIGKNNFRV